MWCIDFYTTRGVAPWWSVERMQLLHVKHRLLYNQGSRPLVVSRENAALTHEAYTSIQPGETLPGGQERECRFNMWRIDFYTTRGVAPCWTLEGTQVQDMKYRLSFSEPGWRTTWTIQNKLNWTSFHVCFYLLIFLSARTWRLRSRAHWTRRRLWDT